MIFPGLKLWNLLLLWCLRSVFKILYFSFYPGCLGIASISIQFSSQPIFKQRLTSNTFESVTFYPLLIAPCMGWGRYIQYCSQFSKSSLAFTFCHPLFGLSCVCVISELDRLCTELILALLCLSCFQDHLSKFLAAVLLSKNWDYNFWLVTTGFPWPFLT